MAQHDLITPLLPVLGRRLDPVFNVFDVMHHGTHEKQLSNVFAWLLKPQATHGFGALFQQLFVRRAAAQAPEIAGLPEGLWTVRQEASTTPEAGSADIADILLDRDDARIVVENYLVSDGHGHGFDNFLAHARTGGRRGAVVMLCQQEDRNLLRAGWEGAAVLTYESLLDELMGELAKHSTWRQENGEAAVFLDQMHRRFVTQGGIMSDQDVLDFVVAMCGTGDAARYGRAQREQQAEQFAADVALQAKERFLEGGEVLRTTRQKLITWSRAHLLKQLRAARPDLPELAVYARYQGIYHYIVQVRPKGGKGEDPRRFELILGPTAWKYIEDPDDWVNAQPPSDPDYRHLFLYRNGHVIRQSAVTLAEVLAGLEPDDHRLCEEALALLDA